jgi:hypothetical protein
MSSVPTQDLTKDSTPRTRRTHSPKTTPKSMDLEALRETIRDEVRGEEFAALQQCLEETAETLVRQSETMLAQGRLLAQATQTIDLMHAMFKSFADNGIQITTPDGPIITINLASGTGSVVEKSDTKPELGNDEYLVESIFMDFIEVHGALSKAGRDRRPLLSDAVHARYSDHSEPELHIRRKGTFGTSESMYNAILTLRIHDNDPYIDGSYTDYGKTVRMSPDQVKRIIDALVAAKREETDSANK